MKFVKVLAVLGLVLGLAGLGWAGLGMLTSPQEQTMHTLIVQAEHFERVVPAEPQNIVKVDRNLLRHALQRAAILSNEKYRGVRLSLAENNVTIQANNPEQEEAEESVEVEYSGDTMEIGFNVTYLLDALSAVAEEQVEVGLGDTNSSCLIRAPGDTNNKFVVMPMRL